MFGCTPCSLAEIDSAQHLHERSLLRVGCTVCEFVLAMVRGGDRQQGGLPAAAPGWASRPPPAKARPALTVGPTSPVLGTGEMAEQHDRGQMTVILVTAH